MFGQWMGDNRIDLELEREEHQMTDKQKEAIETYEELKRNKEFIKNIDKDFFFKSGETALNLIQTQQAEIEHQKEKRENQKKELAILNEKQKEFNKLRNTVNSYKGQFKRQQAEIEKKDKIIDEMAIAIGDEPLPTEEYCIFRNFDCPAVGGNRDCKECVKQYFERKVENGN